MDPEEEEKEQEQEETSDGYGYGPLRIPPEQVDDWYFPEG